MRARLSDFFSPTIEPNKKSVEKIKIKGVIEINVATYFSVAVAVRATNGRPGRTSRSLSNCLYSIL